MLNGERYFNEIIEFCTKKIDVMEFTRKTGYRRNCEGHIEGLEEWANKEYKGLTVLEKMLLEKLQTEGFQYMIKGYLSDNGIPYTFFTYGKPDYEISLCGEKKAIVYGSDERGEFEYGEFEIPWFALEFSSLNWDTPYKIFDVLKDCEVVEHE